MSFNPPPGRGCFTINDFVVDIGDHTVSRGKSVKRVEPKAMHVLYILACDAGDTVERQALLREVWHGRIVVEEALTRIISQLRQVLDDSSQRRLIQTVPKKGYRLRGQVVWQEKPAATSSHTDGADTVSAEQPTLATPPAPAPQPASSTPQNVARDEAHPPASPYRAIKGRWLFTFTLLAMLAMGLGIWRYVSTGQPTASDTPAALSTSVAVMPLRQLSKDESTLYLAEGMTEELIDALASTAELNVPSRYSTLAVNTADKSLTQVAAELDVRYLVEGSVRRINDEFKISVRLIDAKSDRVEWSQSYTNSASSLYAIQQSIAAAIKQVLLPQRTVNSTTQQTGSVSNVEAYQYYLKGNYWLMNGKTSEWYYQTETALQKAVSLAPDFAAAHGKLAFIYARYNFHDTYLPRDIAHQKAQQAITTALQHDPTEQNALLARTILAIDSGDFNRAEATLNDVLERNPQDATALYIFSELALATNQFDAALSFARQAHKQDPLSPWINVNLAIVQFWRGDYKAALQAAQQAIEIDDSYTWAYVWRAKIHHRRGELAAAIETMLASNRIDTASPVNNAYLGLLYFESGQPEEADKWFQRTARLLGDTPHARFWQGFQRFTLDRQAADIAQQLLVNLPSLDNTIFSLVPVLFNTYLQLGNTDAAQAFFTTRLQHGPATMVTIHNHHLAAALLALPQPPVEQLKWQKSMTQFAQIAPDTALQHQIYPLLYASVTTPEAAKPIVAMQNGPTWFDYQWLLTRQGDDNN
ncbi:tetratricopeptide repeat protein [Alteromonas gilva]|uniref:Tetratricopeptide repeat protein n=1 Tax=Alteromonas gilva TaxID=2987522 RepID=A0ABT5L1D2_9ALTE|nr:tetratricopeptide repeat protein [Alteromonas gilva]MDC8830683.1 tetratricopeptide repeat protein [Alteromonas gilva]